MADSQVPWGVPVEGRGFGVEAFNPRIARAQKLSEGPVGGGARFVAQPKGMGAKGKMTLEVVEYEGHIGSTTSCARRTCRSTAC
jgi:hypothetical protein